MSYFFHDYLSQQVHPFGAERYLVRRCLVPPGLHFNGRQIVKRRAHGNAVKIIREALGRNQTLAAAAGTSFEVGIGGFLPVIMGDQLFCDHGRQVYGAITVINFLLDIIVRPRGKVRIVGMTRIGERSGKTQAPGLCPVFLRVIAVNGLPAKPAVADHVQASVPLLRQVDDILYLRRDDAVDLAVCG